MKILSENRKAIFNYQILEKFQAGISLLGQEVKSIKTRGVNLAGSWIVIRNGEVFWIGCKISPYQPKNTPSNYNPERPRKLLLKKSEIRYLIGKSQQESLTMIPLKVYTINGKIKLEFGLGKSRKKFNKKELLKKREIDKEIAREIKEGQQWGDERS